VPQGLVEGIPATFGDPFVNLGIEIRSGTLKQEEVAVLVDAAAPEAEVPIDDLDGAVEDEIIEPRLLSRFAHPRFGRRFAVLQVSLGKSPIPVGIPDEQEVRRLPGEAPKDDAAGTHFTIRRLLAH
jgi:hypothetical protein